MDDLIKRQDMIESILFATADGDKADWIIGVIKSVPSAQKTGKWMTPKEYCQYLYETTGERCSPMATGLESFVYCSQCGEPSWFSKNYCPFCGSRNTGYEEYE